MLVDVCLQQLPLARACIAADSLVTFDLVTQHYLALQEAAGYFRLLHDVAAPQLDEVPSFDVSTKCTEMLELLMLAQAQESFYLKANRDKKNPAVLARCVFSMYPCPTEAQSSALCPPTLQHIAHGALLRNSVQSPLPLLLRLPAASLLNTKPYVHRSLKL